MVARAGIVLALLQFAFALTWVVYVAYLPALAAQVGLPPSVVPWILVVDQVIFLVCDWAAGVFADRLGDAVGRLGRWIALVTLASCAAFLALPLVAPAGSSAAMVVLVVVWSATSSMLRAPPLVLAGRHASRPQRASLAGLYVLGLGAAGAAAPYLAKTLATMDPRIPFAAASIVVAAVTLVLVAIPRGAPAAPPPPGPARPVALVPFAAAVALLAIGFQVHTMLNSPAIYLRHASPEDLVDLLPVFWIGFAIATLPVTLLVQRAGGLVIMTGAGVIGAAATVIVEIADSLTMLVVAQAFAGLAWGGMLVGALVAATTIERRPGGATGLAFSMLAGAAVTRIAFAATEVAATPEVAGAMPFVPPIAWGAGIVVVATFAFRR